MRILKASLKILTAVLFLSSSVFAKQQGRLPVRDDDFRYFLFSSEKPPSKSEISTLVASCGSDIVIGVDSTNTDPPWLKTVQKIQESGARLHVYFGGPGGPTDGKMGVQEKSYIKTAAARIGMRPEDPEWKKTGWLRVLQMDLQECQRLGCYSVEVDNLDQVLGSGAISSEAYIDFLKKFSNWTRSKGGPKLTMKNLSSRVLHRVQDAIEQGSIDRSIFSEFAIFEAKSNQDLEALSAQKESQKIGITTLISLDTNNYAVRGPIRGFSDCSLGKKSSKTPQGWR